VQIDRLFAQVPPTESSSREELTQQLLALLQPQPAESSLPSAPDKEPRREQPDLSHLIAVLKSRLETLEERERRVAEQEADLARRMNWLIQAELEKQHLQMQSHDLGQEIEARQKQLDQLRAQVENITLELDRALLKREQQEKNLPDRQRFLAEQEAQITRQRKILEDRFRELHRAETNLERRLKDLDDVQGRTS
jgi:chromosome segregation ATPase